MSDSDDMERFVEQRRRDRIRNVSGSEESESVASESVNSEQYFPFAISKFTAWMWPLVARRPALEEATKAPVPDADAAVAFTAFSALVSAGGFIPDVKLVTETRYPGTMPRVPNYVGTSNGLSVLVRQYDASNETFKSISAVYSQHRSVPHIQSFLFDFYFCGAGSSPKKYAFFGYEMMNNSLKKELDANRSQAGAVEMFQSLARDLQGALEWLKAQGIRKFVLK